MKSKKLILLLALFITQISIFAQNNSTLPPGGVNPPDPQVEGDGFGAVATPIDMYVYVLVIAAILIIAYFAKKYKAQKI